MSATKIEIPVLRTTTQPPPLLLSYCCYWDDDDCYRYYTATERVMGLSKCKVISTLIGVISTYKYSYLNYNPSYKSHDPLSSLLVEP